MPDDFMIRAALAGLGLCLATGPLGAFVIWRRMAYVSDATSHAAILGVALALATNLPIFLGTLGVAVAMAFAVTALSSKGHAADTALGVLAHSALAAGRARQRNVRLHFIARCRNIPIHHMHRDPDHGSRSFALWRCLAVSCG